MLADLLNIEIKDLKLKVQKLEEQNKITIKNFEILAKNYNNLIEQLRKIIII